MWTYNYNSQQSDELYHHGILGQKWGVRRFEDNLGHLTSAGKKRYDDDRDVKTAKSYVSSAKSNYKKAKKNTIEKLLAVFLLTKRRTPKNRTPKIKFTMLKKSCLTLRPNTTSPNKQTFLLVS